MCSDDREMIGENAFRFGERVLLIGKQIQKNINILHLKHTRLPRGKFGEGSILKGGISP